MPVKDTNYIPNILKNLKDMKKLKVRVGVLGDEDSEMVQIAAANEFGTNRAGKNNKVTIPERSYLRSTFDDSKVIKKSFKSVDRILSPQARRGVAKDAFETMGNEIRSGIVKKINSNIQPKNADATLDKKDSGRTLVDQGDLKKAIDFEVVRR